MGGVGVWITAAEARSASLGVEKGSAAAGITRKIKPARSRGTGRRMLDDSRLAVMLSPGIAMGANRFRRGQRAFRRMQGPPVALQKTGKRKTANDNVELALAA